MINYSFKIKFLGRHADIGVTVFRFGHQHTTSPQRHIIAHLNPLQDNTIHAQKIAVINLSGTR